MSCKHPTTFDIIGLHPDGRILKFKICQVCDENLERVDMSKEE